MRVHADTASCSAPAETMRACRSSLFLRCERVDHVANVPAYPFVSDLVVGADKLKRLALSVDISLATRLGLRAPYFALPLGGLRSQLVEEVRDGDVQHLCELKEPTRAYAVGASLILLHLLKR